MEKKEKLEFFAKDEMYTTWYRCPDCKETNVAQDFNFCPDCGKDLKDYTI